MTDRDVALLLAQRELRDEEREARRTEDAKQAAIRAALNQQ